MTTDYNAIASLYKECKRASVALADRDVFHTEVSREH
jgi:hypothetical protein